MKARDDMDPRIRADFVRVWGEDFDKHPEDSSPQNEKPFREEDIAPEERRFITFRSDYPDDVSDIVLEPGHDV